jgi:hypothetical protein
MAYRGVLFAITEDHAEKLRAARGDDGAVLSIVQDEIEEAWDEAHLCQTDKAWDAIHRCLTDGTLRDGKGPLGWCILGGEQLHQDEIYVVSLLTPEQVGQVAEALRPLTKEWMRERYFKIDQADYAMRSDEDFEYTWDWLQGVREYYAKTAAEGRWSMFTVDQ